MSWVRTAAPVAGFVPKVPRLLAFIGAHSDHLHADVVTVFVVVFTTLRRG